ncbi:hypothetical protein MSG28_014915 [Choristoneura fumiferana]|uniref:Uncharacterized protein n=1 Tax=Choristoneura fumiferana TaxID=7141 RepID=A0ACC0KYL5_CHOFU|nr:hypothetical protein MSG28_014915 [Choristoneura fumiferana]
MIFHRRGETRRDETRIEICMHSRAPAARRRLPPRAPPYKFRFSTRLVSSRLSGGKPPLSVLINTTVAPAGEKTQATSAASDWDDYLSFTKRLAGQRQKRFTWHLPS